MDHSELWHLIETHREGLIAFTQKLIQTPSLSGQEGDVAALIQTEMKRLDYDEIWTDQVGNVIGRIKGEGGPSLMFNGHMDHVDAGDPDRWPHPPFDGIIHGGELWGRGTADMKGALAAMVYAGGIAKKLGTPLPGDRLVAAVVQEEVGGLGSRHLTKTLPVARAVIGEASNNHLRRGHRGRVELIAHFTGRSVHASMPDLGINPHYSLARFLSDLRSLTMASDPAYGISTVAPTRLVSEPDSANITPSAVHLWLDWRNVPGERDEVIVSKLEVLLARSLEPECKGRIEIGSKELSSYTGARMTYPSTFPPFTTPLDHPWLVRVQGALEEVLGRTVQVGTWRFATDGGHLAAAGSTVLGFGPGDDTIVHTTEERLPLDELVESVVGYVVLSLQP